MSALIAKKLLPISVVIPTRHRAEVLRRTLESLDAQGVQMAELIVVDASDDDATKRVVADFDGRWKESVAVRWIAADKMGAAVQRNQGVAAATQPVIAFMDDDILFEADCIVRLWAALQSASNIGGVNAMITNQKFHPPGFTSRLVYQFLDCGGASYAGRILGPAVNLLPEDRDDLAEMVPVEWMNLGCTFYRREALPIPPFKDFFTGYSMFEDVALSATIANKWQLLNARTARIFHDSQPSPQKSNRVKMAEMETVNRYFVMTEVLGRSAPVYKLQFIVWQLFSLASMVYKNRGFRGLIDQFSGYVMGWKCILTRTRFAVHK